MRVDDGTLCSIRKPKPTRITHATCLNYLGVCLWFVPRVKVEFNLRHVSVDKGGGRKNLQFENVIEFSAPAIAWSVERRSGVSENWCWVNWFYHLWAMLCKSSSCLKFVQLWYLFRAFKSFLWFQHESSKFAKFHCKYSPGSFVLIIDIEICFERFFWYLSFKTSN